MDRLIDAVFSTQGWTIIGAVIGFALSEWSTRSRERRTAGETERSVRALVALEVEQNCSALAAFRGEVAEVDEDGRPGVSDPVDLARRFVQLPFPPLSRRFWERHLASLPAALTPEEIRAAYQFHETLDRLKIARELLAEIEARDQESRQAAHLHYGGPTLPIHAYSPSFPRQAGELWEQCRWEMDDALGIGARLRAMPERRNAGRSFLGRPPRRVATIPPIPRGNPPNPSPADARDAPKEGG